MNLTCKVMVTREKLNETKDKIQSDQEEEETYDESEAAGRMKKEHQLD